MCWSSYLICCGEGSARIRRKRHWVPWVTAPPCFLLRTVYSAVLLLQALGPRILVRWHLRISVECRWMSNSKFNSTTTQSWSQYQSRRVLSTIYKAIIVRSAWRKLQSFSITIRPSSKNVLMMFVLQRRRLFNSSPAFGQHSCPVDPYRQSSVRLWVVYPIGTWSIN